MKDRIRMIVVEVVLATLFAWMIVRGLTDYLVKFIPDWLLIICGVIGLIFVVLLGWRVR
jgi:hypothetical protein